MHQDVIDKLKLVETDIVLSSAQFLTDEKVYTLNENYFVSLLDPFGHCQHNGYLYVYNKDITGFVKTSEYCVLNLQNEILLNLIQKGFAAHTYQ